MMIRVSEQLVLVEMGPQDRAKDGRGSKLEGSQAKIQARLALELGTIHKAAEDQAEELGTSHPRQGRPLELLEELFMLHREREGQRRAWRLKEVLLSR